MRDDSGLLGGRTDALQNRDGIVETARKLLAERGLDLPMTAIARRAGGAVATLYRRFPTKESLIIEAFADQFAACASLMDDALADPDPWRGRGTSSAAGPDLTRLVRRSQADPGALRRPANLRSAATRWP
ncbi:TetR/AcrR family transcriptional regulator [Plantactinospora soyae]|uniref:AcrR family transcriptional regulator n=1 Tax=Plantactinospora soyae TaxID=1544732 RepID=A0A927MA19_9ACTN|nr:helix-turn-helix domain-containing protein [Plantactinospora soyae]MBE1490704.1 AcrR family transcriptional regulator [Plantactinospora soyae]